MKDKKSGKGSQAGSRGIDLTGFNKKEKAAFRRAGGKIEVEVVKTETGILPPGFDDFNDMVETLISVRDKAINPPNVVRIPVAIEPEVVEPEVVEPEVVEPEVVEPEVVEPEETLSVIGERRSKKGWVKYDNLMDHPEVVSVEKIENDDDIFVDVGYDADNMVVDTSDPSGPQDYFVVADSNTVWYKFQNTLREGIHYGRIAVAALRDNNYTTQGMCITRYDMYLAWKVKYRVYHKNKYTIAYLTNAQMEKMPWTLLDEGYILKDDSPSAKLNRVLGNRATISPLPKFNNRVASKILPKKRVKRS